MKRCFFANADIQEFKWMQNGEYICYPCHVRESEGKRARCLEHAIRTDALLEKAAAHEYQKKKARRNRNYRKVKVDRRIIGGLLPPLHPVPGMQERVPAPQLEGLMWPRIRYPFIASSIGIG